MIDENPFFVSCLSLDILHRRCLDDVFFCLFLFLCWDCRLDLRHVKNIMLCYIKETFYHLENVLLDFLIWADEREIIFLHWKTFNIYGIEPGSKVRREHSSNYHWGKTFLLNLRIGYCSLGMKWKRKLIVGTDSDRNVLNLFLI